MLDIARRERTWADRAHLAFQNIDELRDLVESGRPQHSADAGRASVSHRPDLEDGEESAVVPETLLAEQDGAAVLDEDRERGKRRDRRKDNHAGAGTRDVKGAFETPNHTLLYITKVIRLSPR
jgi:hypothetical protein